MQVIVLVAVVGYLDEVFDDDCSLLSCLALEDLGRHPGRHLWENEQSLH